MNLRWPDKKMDLINHKTIAPFGLANIIFSSTLYGEANVYYSKFLSNLGSIDLTDKNFPFFFIWSQKKMVYQIVTVQRNYFWEWAIRHTAERPKISGTVIQKAAMIKTHSECPELKEDIKKEREDNNVNGERETQIGFRNQQIKRDLA